MKLLVKDLSVSIILINRNGEDLLPTALHGIAESVSHAVKLNVLTERQVELIVVDNGSSDRSVDLIRAFKISAPFDIKLVAQPEAGVNFARNSGVEAASGTYLIFVDNDLLFTKEWLAGFVQAFQGYPEQIVFGGRVLLGNVGAALPAWLDLRGSWSRPSIVVRCDNGVEASVEQLGNPLLDGPVGPNMAFSKQVFATYGLFDVRYGLRPGSLVAGAEAEFFHRLSKHNLAFVYVAEACVYHPLRASQMSKAYFKKRLCGVGRVLARLQKADGIEGRRVLGVKRYLVRQLVEALSQYLFSIPRASAQQRFFYRCNVSIVWGQIIEDFQNRNHAFEPISSVTDPEVVVPKSNQVSILQ